MPAVSIDNLKPGMKLAKPVVNDAGMVLLSRGTELTDSLINRLRNMSLPTVSIVGESGPQKSEAELLAELEARFSKTASQKYMDLIKRAFVEHISGMFRNKES